MVIDGLLGKSKNPAVRVVEDQGGKGRGLIAEQLIYAGEYICEYEGEVYSRKVKAEKEEEYSLNQEGCYIFECRLPNDMGWICVDATRHYSSLGR